MSAERIKASAAAAASTQKAATFHRLTRGENRVDRQMASTKQLKSPQNGVHTDASERYFTVRKPPSCVPFLTLLPSPQPFSMAAVYGDALAKLNRMDVLIVGMTGSGVETGDYFVHFFSPWQLFNGALAFSRLSRFFFGSQEYSARDAAQPHGVRPGTRGPGRPLFQLFPAPRACRHPA